jgi:hypothetical protein
MNNLRINAAITGGQCSFAAMPLWLIEWQSEQIQRGARHAVPPGKLTGVRDYLPREAIAVFT